MTKGEAVLQLRDTLSGATRPFVPLNPDQIGIYSCGPTIYGPAHIGNFRSFLFADLLVRWLRASGHTVRWVVNLTDIDDKISKRTFTISPERTFSGHCTRAMLTRHPRKKIQSQ